MPSRLEIIRRRWSDDDASGYASLPADWPHDEYCLACADLQTVTGPRSARNRNRARYTDWDWRGFEANEVAQQYPNRFRALIDHRSEVRRARRAAAETS